jgi:hypothetical protein
MSARRLFMLAFLAAAPLVATAGVVEVHTWAFTQEGPLDTCHTWNVFDDAGTPSYAFDDRWIGAYGWCPGEKPWTTTSVEPEEGERASIERRPGQIYQRAPVGNAPMPREETTVHADLLAPGQEIDENGVVEIIEELIARRREE